MENTFGYKPLSYELIKLFRSGAPDFAAAEELIRQGADVNDQGDDKSCNVLSEIILYYHFSSSADQMQEVCKNCHSRLLERRCQGCEHNLNPNLGESMIKVIQFFLDHGFNVDLNEGRHGAQCLYSLYLSCFDRYMIDATKMLLDAGAQDIPIEDDPYDTPMCAFGEEAGFQDSEQNHYLGGIYYATYQIFKALKEVRSYSGIDNLDAAIGKKVLRVLADSKAEDPVFFTVDQPQSKHKNCFICDLYVVFDCGFLICTKYADYWVDTVLPDRQLIDVSAAFAPIIGSSIQKVTYDHNDYENDRRYYGQPITTFHMDNGVKLTFTINFGEVETKNFCSYFYYGDAETP